MSELHLWAKKNEVDGRWGWLPLKQHLLDTKNVANQLWNHWLSDGQKKMILDAVDSRKEEDGQKLIKLIALLHDCGKNSACFQAKKGFSTSYDLDKFLLERLEHDGLSGISTWKCASTNKTPHSLASAYILKNFGFNDEILSIIGAHHGMSVKDKYSIDEQKSFLSNYYQSDDIDNELSKIWIESQKELIEWALEQSGYSCVEDIPSIKQPGQVMILGLLIMADWIASNTNYFPLIDIEEESISNQTYRFQNGWRKWFKSFPIKPDIVNGITEIYKERFDFDTPNSVQIQMSNVVDKMNEAGLLILEAPMGIGKTEAALVALEKLAEKFGYYGVFFGLPTQATTDAMFSRILKWLSKITANSEEEVSIELIHSKASLNEEFTELKKNINIYDEESNAVIVNQWFSGRKTRILDDFTVGTVDQFLLAALNQKHLALRHLGLSRKIVVIDEVHAFDTYMSAYFERTLEWMGAYNVPVILLSATLPAKKREDFSKAYLRGKGKKTLIYDANELNSDKYPLITYTSENSIMQESDFDMIESINVDVENLAEELLENKLKDLVRGEGIVGIIVNTVNRAQQLARICRNFSIKFHGEDCVDLFHSSFISADRAKKEKLLVDMIGKSGIRPKRRIIIGTQILEQSLDLDFDILLSDLAPMDVLLQRIGRLHRHSDTIRPNEYKEPKVYVLGTCEELDFEEGSEYVYGGYLLARTQYLLDKKISLPYDISKLVQKTYDFKNYMFDKLELEEKYRDMKSKFESKSNIKKEKAKAYLLSPPKVNKKRGNNLFGWGLEINPNDSEEYAYAQVRDIEETVEIIALKNFGSGYSLFNGNEDLSNRTDEVLISRKIAQATIRLPLIFSKFGRIDKTIADLEKSTKLLFPSWRNNPMLNGSLGVIFDENGEATISDIRVKYDIKYGLMRKED